MARPMPDYRLVQQIEQLTRRVESLEKKTVHLQRQNEEMYKVLSSRASFLDFKFYNEAEEYEEQQRRERERSRMMMNALSAF